MTYSDDELRALWRAAGGSFHGPVVETGDMPESLLLPFLQALLAGRHPHPAANDPDTELRSKLIEQTAQVIYGTWSGDRGFVSWLVGGNSLMQDKARQLARTHRIAKADTGPGYVMALANGTKIHGDLTDDGEFFVP